MSTTIDDLYRRAGITPQDELRVEPRMLAAFAACLRGSVDQLASHPAEQAPDTAAAALPLSDTGRACTAASHVLRAALRALEDRLTDMELITLGISASFLETDKEASRILHNGSLAGMHAEETVPISANLATDEQIAQGYLDLASEQQGSHR